MIYRAIARAFMALDWVMQRTVAPLFDGFSRFLDKTLDAENEIKRKRLERRNK